jgi:pimeloyl-ACP methyl ester carboxylesterase
VLLGVIGGLVLAYAIILPALYFSQRSLIYPAPPRFPDLPEGYGAVRLRTADGLELAAAYLPPRPGKPVLVFFHGNGDSWDGAAQANAVLVAAGYGVLVPEYRGYGTNPGSPSETGLYADGRAALGWLVAQGVPERQIVLVGNSLGSGVATQLASERKVRALVLVSAFSALPDIAAEKFWWLPVRSLVKDRFDNIGKLAKISPPVLIIHGLADTMIPPDHAERLAAARMGAGLVLVPGQDHDLAYSPVSQAAVLNWLERLPSEPPPDPGRNIGQPDMQPAQHQP